MASLSEERNAKLTFDVAADNRSRVLQAGLNEYLTKLGAVQEGVLRGSLLKDGKFLDQVMWSIVAQDWFQAKAVWSAVLH